ncbi:ATP-binding protein [Streptomyces sp. NPDC057217]|uniref:ATP-binding protein n=1 Tax=Streptomyces sp. NPDC057217 TaxID=3346054 RepID=UPI003644CCF0
MTPARLESVPAMRRFVRSATRQWGLCETADEALALVVSELVSNAVLHSGSTDVEVTVGLTGTTLIVRVRDHGHWPVQSATRRPREEDGACFGRGLRLVAAYADRTWTTCTEAGTTAAAELDLPAPAPQVSALVGTGPRT